MKNVLLYIVLYIVSGLCFIIIACTAYNNRYKNNIWRNFPLPPGFPNNMEDEYAYIELALCSITWPVYLFILVLWWYGKIIKILAQLD